MPIHTSLPASFLVYQKGIVNKKSLIRVVSEYIISLSIDTELATKWLALAM